MKIMFKAAVFLIFLSIALVGCGAEDDARGFLLLNPGVTWYYDVDIQGEKLEMQVQVGETKNIAGKTAYPLSYSYNELALPTQIEYYAVQDKAVLFPRLDNVQGQFLKKPEQTFLKFPLKEGDKWEWSGRLIPVGEKEAVASGKVQAVVESKETVNTPAGTYKDAVRISFVSVNESGDTRFDIKEKRWYVKGVGMVKEVLYDEKGNEVLTAVLKKLEK
ncbi:MAG: hypothetical protein ACOX4H_12105 [Bacillota bacterium]|nr:hypothetical protein [Clostridia bacterium]